MSRTSTSPTQVIARKIESTVRRVLEDAGSTVTALSVEVAEDRDSATPFEVRYRGFRASPAARRPRDGSFRMEYAGQGRWRGRLAGLAFDVPVGRTDDVDLPFVDDPRLIGAWHSIDFVPSIASFDPARRRWSGALHLQGLAFRKGGRTAQRWVTWTRGRLLHHGDRTASRYAIRRIGGQEFLFLEWKSGDVTISRRRPHYYVLARP